MSRKPIVVLILLFLISGTSSNRILNTSQNFSDEFSDPLSLNNWSVMNENAGLGFQISNDKLSFDHQIMTSWWEYQKDAPYLYQNVTGDFDVTTSVRINQSTNLAQYISDGYHYAGIMIRDPTSDGVGSFNNFVFIAAGYQYACGGNNAPCIELKNTINDIANIIRIEIPIPERKLRLERSNSDITVYSRAFDSDPWTMHNTYVRTDLPETVQLGLIGFSFTINVQMAHMEYDYFRFLSSIQTSTNQSTQSISQTITASSQSQPHTSSDQAGTIESSNSIISSDLTESTSQTNLSTSENPTTPMFEDTISTNPLPINFSLIGIMVIISYTYYQNKQIRNMTQ